MEAPEGATIIVDGVEYGVAPIAGGPSYGVSGTILWAGNVDPDVLTAFGLK